MLRGQSNSRLAVVVAALAVTSLLAPAAAGLGGEDGTSATVAQDGIYVGEIEPGGSTQRTVTLSPDQPWTVSDVSVTGTDADAFAVVSGGDSFTLDAGESRDITISFGADELGAKNATLVIDEANGTIETPVSGEVVEDTSGSSGADVVENVSFGEVPVGETVTETVTIPGSDGRDITATASLIGTDTDQFRIVDGGGTFTVPAGGSHDITVAYAPDEAGAAVAQIELIPEDDSLDPRYVDLRGEGVDGGEVSVSQSSLSFGSVPLDRLQPDFVTVENTGEETVTLSASATVDAGPGDLYLDRRQLTIAPGDQAFVPVVFAPGAEEQTTGTVVLDAPSLSDPLTVSVSGSGVRAAADDPLAVVAENVTVTADTVDQQSTLPLYLRNRGTDTLEVSVGDLSGAFDVVAGGGTVTLVPGEFHVVRASYDPSVSTLARETLTLSPSTGDPVEIDLTGRTAGTDVSGPNVSLSTATLSFDTVAVGDDATRDVRVSNDGSEAVTIGAADVSGPFAVVDAEPTTVSPGESRTLTVRFAPEQAGEAGGSLIVVAEGDGGVTEREVSLSGVGTAPGIEVTVGDDRLTTDDPTTTVAISNTGEGPLTVSELTAPGPFAFELGAPLQVPAGETREVTLRFDDTGDANVTTTLRIGSDDPDRPVVRRRVRGVVEGATASLDVEGSVDADRQRVNASVTDVADDSTVSVDTSTDVNTSERVALREVAIDVDRGESFTLNVTTGDEALSTSPAFDRGNATFDVGYLSVNHTTPDENIDSVGFTYTVPDERLPTNATTGEPKPEDVALYRFVDGEWVELETDPVREVQGGWQFQSISPGLSEFAIGRKEPRFEISGAEINVSSVQVGDGVAVRVLITNVGSADGIYDVELFENGERVDRRRPTVPPNSTVRLVFLRSYESAGDYRIDVNNRTVDTLSVQAPPGETTSPPGTATTRAPTEQAAGAAPSSDGSGGGIPVLPLLAVGLVVTAGAGIAYRRLGGDGGGDVDDRPVGRAPRSGGADAGQPGNAEASHDGDHAREGTAREAPAESGSDGEWTEFDDWDGQQEGRGDERQARRGDEQQGRRQDDRQNWQRDDRPNRRREDAGETASGEDPADENAGGSADETDGGDETDADDRR